MQDVSFAPAHRAPASTQFAQRILVRGLDLAGKPGTCRTGLAWIAMEAPFAWVRVWYHNANPEPYVVARTTVQSGRDHESFIPWDEHGIPQLMRDAFAPGPDGEPGDGSAPLIVPGGSPGHPAYACTDWVRVESVPRRGGGWRPLLQIRTTFAFTAAQPLVHVTNLTEARGWEGEGTHRGRLLALYETNEARADDPIAERFHPSNRCYFAGIEAAGAGAVHTVMSAGDSLTMGTGSTADVPGIEAVPCHVAGFGHLATAMLSTPERPIAHLAAGWAGQPTELFVARALDDVHRFRPSVVTIPVYSPNNVHRSNTMATVEAGFNRALDLADAVRAYGGVPILWTPFAHGAKTSAEQDAPRRWAAREARAMGARGEVLVADFDPVISVGDPGVIHPDYDCGDRLHVNNAGHWALARALVPVLRRALFG